MYAQASNLDPRTSSTRSGLASHKHIDEADPLALQKLPDSSSPIAHLEYSNHGISVESSGQRAHKRFVFADPVAFSYLEEDSSVTVLDRHRRLEGYELYIVEQWACSRVDPTIFITTYTGNPSQSVLVGVLSVPKNEDEWSPRLKIYFKAVAQFHARSRETPLGTIMITNLSSFPSALTVILVPDGQAKKHREDFFVNEDLKRLGCSGRAGLTLSTPTGAAQTKFQQLYKTSDQVPVKSAVIEMVRMCQISLILFNKICPEFADGLLCDITEKAINDWWTELGSDYYNLEPTDGILGPTTVAGLIGMLMGARNRLNTYGAPVPKDCFDVINMKRGIANFQKSQKLERSRRLDRQTLDRLHRVTTKAASGEGWYVPKAVKTTVAELSSKGGDMVMGMVGGRDKAGIAEIETVDIERFVQLLQGERSKWLWHGKARKGTTSDMFEVPGEESSLVFVEDDKGHFVWTSTKRSSVDPPGNDGNMSPIAKHAGQSTASLDSPTNKEQGKRTVFKSVTDKMSDARSGFGRIRDAVGLPGLRGHHHRHSKEYMANDYSDEIHRQYSRHSGESPRPTSKAGPRRNSSEQPDGEVMPKTRSLKALIVDKLKDKESEPSSTTSKQKDSAFDSRYSLLASAAGSDTSPGSILLSEAGKRLSTGYPQMEPSVAGSVFHDEDYEDAFPNQELPGPDTGSIWRRTHSLSRIQTRYTNERNEAWWPRHLSFSEAEDSVLLWDDISDGSQPHHNNEFSALQDITYLRDLLSSVEIEVGQWVADKIENVQGLESTTSRDQDELNALYHQHLQVYQRLRMQANNLLADESSQLADIIKEVEVLGAKLEYEVATLESKVSDAEDSIAMFEKQVNDIEARVIELEAEEGTSNGWMPWMLKWIPGIG
ncbi:MAG: hypothetical protein M1829_006805 [Trizodia sp. TS-e1964]|nr:MAG: hypothetical protein M1829_006805 [Trizodia sp. TS-e1964]